MSVADVPSMASRVEAQAPQFGLLPAGISHHSQVPSRLEAVHREHANHVTEFHPGSETRNVEPVSPGHSSQPPHAAPETVSIREIHKNGWLKKMPLYDRRPGPFGKAPKPEKFWVVFCVHNDKDAFLEFYDNRRSACSHNPLSSYPLSKCLHISPTIVVQEDDYEFAITLDTLVIRLAAVSREQMVEWIDTMRSKLRDLGVLQPRDNVYSKEPLPLIRNQCLIQGLPSPNLLQDRLSNSAVEGQQNMHADPVQTSSSRDPLSPLPPAPITESADNVSNSFLPARSYPAFPHQSQQTQASWNHRETVTTPPATNVNHSATANVFNFDFVISALYDSTSTQNERQSSVLECENVSPLTSPNIGSSAASSPNMPSTSETSSIYEPLFLATSTVPSQRVPVMGQVITRRRLVGANQNRSRSESEFTAASVPTQVIATASPGPCSSTAQAPVQLIRAANRGRTRALGSATSSSEPSLNCLQPTSENSISHRNSSGASIDQVDFPVGSSSAAFPGNSILPADEGPPPYDSLVQSHLQLPSTQGHNQQNSNLLNTDESGRPISLRESQVLKLLTEISHKSGVRLVLRKKDCVGAIALVDCFNVVWIAGWKQKEHPLLHNTFHIGDRVLCVAGRRIHSVQEAQKAIRHQPLVVEFIVRRVPHCRVFAIKRDHDRQDLGLIRENNTAEIKEVKPDGLAARHGLPAKAPSADGTGFSNWVLTEINNRPLNLFFKGNEVQDRLNAVGRDISILVQPADLVKALKKQLKTLHSYKEYIVQ